MFDLSAMLMVAGYITMSSTSPKPRERLESDFKWMRNSLKRNCTANGSIFCLMGLLCSGSELWSWSGSGL